MDTVYAAQEVCLQEQGRIVDLAAYVAYVFFTGYVSSAMQVQFTEQLVNSPLLAKIVVELVIWIFNFMFLRDIIFRRWSEA